MADNVLDFSINSKEVVYSNISTSKNNYNHASITVKKDDKEFMTISYEWENSKMPSFVLDLMKFMKGNGVETSGVWPDKEEDYKKFIEVVTEVK